MTYADGRSYEGDWVGGRHRRQGMAPAMPTG